MMSFLDYIFYRVYKINYPNHAPLEKGIISTWCILEGLTSPIWFGINVICYGRHSEIGPISWIFIALIGVALIFGYTKKKKMILERFEDSKYDKLIPFWTILIFMLLCFGVGLFLAAKFVDPYIESHNLEGYLYDEIPGFLK